MAPKAARAPLDALARRAAAFCGRTISFPYNQLSTLTKLSPAVLRLTPSQATRRPPPKDLSGFIHFRAGSNIFELASTTHTLPRRHTAAELTKMVLSAPAEPVFLVGVALGVLIAGAIFALNMRRWRAQQRLR